MVDNPAQLFRVMADPIRLRILHLLRDGELCVADLVTVLAIPQPVRHAIWRRLKRAGLVTARKNSYWTYYALALARTPLHRKVLECLDADSAGRAREAKRLAAVRGDGGCCPNE